MSSKLVLVSSAPVYFFWGTKGAGTHHRSSPYDKLLISCWGGGEVGKGVSTGEYLQKKSPDHLHIKSGKLRLREADRLKASSEFMAGN